MWEPTSLARISFSIRCANGSYYNLLINQQAEPLPLLQIVTVASCSANSLAPIVKVIHEKIGIHHSSITTIQCLINSQSILDQPHKDLRRARASSLSLIPTTTGSATAITEIFSGFERTYQWSCFTCANGKCFFDWLRIWSWAYYYSWRNQSASEEAAQDELKDILGHEERPLVTIDYKIDPRSSIVVNGPDLVSATSSHLGSYPFI